LKPGAAMHLLSAVFDGRPNPFYEVFLDPRQMNSSASACSTPSSFSLCAGVAAREAEGFLRSYYAERPPQGGCFVWDGRQGAIALLGLRYLESLVEKALGRGFVSSCW
jgi:hypothetical protein